MKILIVDDNEDSRIILKKILESDGHTVEVAANGEEALKAAKESLPDMIISDSFMPVMDGFTLCRKWKRDERLEKIPFIFYTASYTDRKDEELAMSMGADWFIVKPVEADKFIEIIQGVIGDMEKGKVKPKKADLEEEKEVFKLYSERLVKKLEQKMLDLEREITERKRAEEELRRSREELRSLTAYLQTAREEERTSIAREIHDDLGQTLMTLKMDLSWLRDRLSKHQKALIDKTKLMLQFIDMTAQTVRRISAQLRPALLDDLGLKAAIEWQAEAFENRTGIICKLTTMGIEDIPPDRDLSTAIFRIFQETLTNVTRHAKATSVKASLKEETGKLTLEVRDNGKGITEEQISDPKSFGLIGMRERARFFRGEVKISGIRGKGSRVRASIPLAHLRDEKLDEKYLS